MIDILSTIATELNSIGLNYEFETWSAEKVKYPYWVGEYQEVESTTEDGIREVDFILTGTSRSGALALEKDRAKIEQLFPRIEGKTAKMKNGGFAVIFYTNALTVPVDDGELTRLQVNLTIKEWQG